MSETFSHDELIAALLGARVGTDGDPEAVSVQELARRTGKSNVAIARRLRLLMEAGQVACVRVPWRRIDGAQTTIPAYKFIGGQDESGGAN